MRKIVLCVAAGMLVCCGQLCEGKSVFAVANHGTSVVKAYKIDGEGLEFQDTIEGTEHFGVGATGLCVWPSLELMFVTYESSAVITWASTKTLSRDFDDEISAPEGNLAGVVADETNGVLYVVTRQYGRLYTYTFDAADDTLVLIHPNDPAYPDRKYRQLEGLESGSTYGLALDADGGEPVLGFPTGLLYVADGTETVRYYNTMTWGLEGSVDMGRGAVGIDVDGNGYLYAGGYLAHNYLLRYDLLGDPNDPETALEKDVGAKVTDISVDRDTGLVYTTTRRVVHDRTGAVEVYDWVSADPNTVMLTDIESDEDFAGPAGIAVGASYKPPRMVVEKTDDVDESSESVLPGNEITYSIVVRPGVLDEPNVVVTDRLPESVDFVSADPNDGYYDADAHAYVWDVGYLSGYDPNDPSDPNVYLALTVRVNELAEPAANMVNILQTESDEAYTDAEAPTPVGCWGGDVIFVDQFAAGAETGVDWPNAYTDLQDALLRADRSCGSEIWVAQGLYSPGDDPIEDTFKIPDGVAVYGGFAGNETTRDQRDFSCYKTTLSGYIGKDPDGFAQRNNTVVAMGDNSLLDSVAVTEAGIQHGIDGSNVSSAVVNCIVEDNERQGIFCENGNLAVHWCVIKDNGYDGVYSEANGGSLEVANSKLFRNGRNGVFSLYSVPTIINSIMYENGSESANYYGLSINQPSASPAIHNCTIVHNNNESIGFTGTYLPDVRNCILWGNNGGQAQLAGLYPDEVYFSCVQDCNDVNYQNNINEYPGFAYSYPEYGYYHLASDSNCIDAGDNTYVATGELDIDGDDRIYGTYVDMGADEAACGDVSSPADLTGDGIVNFGDFGVLAAAWLSTDPNEPGITTDPNYINEPNYRDPAGFVAWNGLCDFDADYDVDLADLGYFVIDGYWLWQACWRESSEGIWMMGGEMMQSSYLLESVALEPALPLVAVREPTIEEKYAQAKEVTEWLENLWANDEEIKKVVDKKDWKNFMAQIYDWLANIEQEL